MLLCKPGSTREGPFIAGVTGFHVSESLKESGLAQTLLRQEKCSRAWRSPRQGVKVHQQILTSLHILVLSLNRDDPQIAETPGGRGWRLASISWQLPWEGVSPDF